MPTTALTVVFNLGHSDESMVHPLSPAAEKNILAHLHIFNNCLNIRVVLPYVRPGAAIVPNSCTFFSRPNVSVKIRRNVVHGILVSSPISRTLSRRSPVIRYCTAASFQSEDLEIGLPGRDSA